jgi:tRNA threonylcarbamoyl adenosine modification protein (Sua5/YciO/YrdC/YwlC family)
MIHFEIHPVNPQRRLLEQTVSILKNENGICIYPTDTVYGLGGCATNPKAIGRMVDIVRRDKTRLFSFICSDFSQISRYAKISNNNFKLMKRYLPGPFTFILPATNYVPKKICPKRKTVGVRIPDYPVCRELVALLDEPLANTSIAFPGEQHDGSEKIPPGLLSRVDIMLDVGALDTPLGSTVVDLTGDEPAVLRQGKGTWDEV